MTNFTLAEFATYVRRLPQRLHAAAERGIALGAMRAIPVFQRAGDTAPPASPNGTPGAFSTGAYRRGWRARRVAGGAQVYNVEAYAPVIDLGRRPGRKMPPLAVVERWAKLKLHLTAAEAKAAAFPIARAIGRRGLRARGVTARAHPEATRVVLAEMRAEVSRAMRRGK